MSRAYCRMLEGKITPERYVAIVMRWVQMPRTFPLDQRRLRSR